MGSEDFQADGLIERVATAPVAAAGLIGGFAIAELTGSRPLGGVALAGFGLSCIAVWLRRDGRRTAALLTAAGLAAFAMSHLLGAVIGAWPAVLLVAAGVAALCWRVSDARRPVAGVRRRAEAGSPRTGLHSDRRGSRA